MPGNEPEPPGARHIPGEYVWAPSVLEEALQFLQLQRCELIAQDATSRPVSGLLGLSSRRHMAWLLRWLLPGLLAAIAALVVPVAFLAHVAHMVHAVRKARTSFLHIEFSGFWRWTLHRFRSYFHFVPSQDVLPGVIVVAPGRRLHGWRAMEALCLHELC